MVKQGIIVISILAVITLLLWGYAKKGSAEQAFYASNKILSQLERILENQNNIISSLEEIKTTLASKK